MDAIQNEYGLLIFWKDLLELCQEGSILLILDGLDEMSQDGQRESVLTHLSLISHLVDAGARVIISCRTHYLRSDSELIGLLDESGLPCQEITLFDLIPFNADQIERYINARLPENKRKRWLRLKKTPMLGLSALNSRPFLLNTLIHVLSGASDNETIRATQIFDEYLRGWLERDRWRFEQFLSDFQSSIVRDLMSVQDGDLLPDVDPKTDLIAWSEELLTRFVGALALHMRLQTRRNEFWLSADEIADFLRKKLPSLPDVFIAFFEYALRTCSFLSRDENGRYGFLHESIQSFLAADALHKELRRQVYSWDHSPVRGRPQIPAIPSSLGAIKLDEQTMELLFERCNLADKTVLTKIIKDPDRRIERNPNTLSSTAQSCSPSMT